jgi:8-oxo-dGTP pyrophosphatase MutT (NUDIX family)
MSIINRLRKTASINIAGVKTKPHQTKHDNFHQALAEYLYKELKKNKLNVSKLNELTVSVACDRTTDNRFNHIVIDCLDGQMYLSGQGYKDRRIGKLLNFKGNRASDAYQCMKNSIHKILSKIDRYNVHVIVNDLRNANRTVEAEESTIDKVVYQDEWISIIDRNGYKFLHEQRCNGQIVAILPVRDSDNGIEFLLRKEICPPHGDESQLCCLTGGYDDDSISVDDTMVKELKEEAGYEVSTSKLVSLDWVYNSKAADTKVHLYTIDLTGVEQGIATTDGTELEKLASAEWCDLDDVMNCNDSYVLSILARIENNNV